MDSYSLEPQIQAFEAEYHCRICLHPFSDAFFRWNWSFVNFIRCSHRKTFPCRCGREQKSYCLRHCMDLLNQRFAAHPERDLYLVHCRNHCVELVSPVFRHGRCELVLFAGLLDTREKEQVRKIALMLPVFAAGLNAKVHDVCGVDRLNQESFAEKVQTFLEEHYAEPVSSADAAKNLCLSLSRFCHVLRESGMKPFSELLTEERIRHAQQFLRCADYDFRLSDIAGLCGFRQYEHFSRTFRRITGVSPAQWRRKQTSEANSKI